MNPIESAKILKEQLILALGSELGKYRRPGFSDGLAIWVWESQSPVPSNYKVITATDRSKLLIPAIEVIIRKAASYSEESANYNHRAIDQSWSVHLMFHDSRQSELKAILSIMQNFACAEPTHLEASELHPEQYVFKIENHMTIVRK